MLRAAYLKVMRPMARAALRAGLTPNMVTIAGTVATVLAAAILFPTGHLFVGAVVVYLFVLADDLDGIMAREGGGTTRFGAVLDASCDRIADGTIFGSLLWWSAFGLHNPPLTAAVLISLVASEVISYVKARAEASGLRADIEIIQRRHRLLVVLVAAALADLPFSPMPVVFDVAMWALAAASVLTVVQRLHVARSFPGATTKLPRADGDGATAP